VADPVVATVSKMEAGHRPTAWISRQRRIRRRRSLRTLSAASRARLRRGAGAAGGAHQRRRVASTATTVIVPGFPVTVCDARAVDLGEGKWRAAHWRARASSCAYGAPDSRRAEDFAYVLEQTPGAMFFLGVAHEGRGLERAAARSVRARMMLDESVMPLGAAVLAGCAERFLAARFT